MSAGYTNLRTVSYRDTIAELIARANQTHTRATGVQVFSPGDGMAYEDDEGFINPISPSLFDDAKRQIAEASESLVATEEELEAAKLILEDNTLMLGELDEQAKATAEEMKTVVADLDEDEKRLTAAQADIDDLKPRLGEAETAISASDAKAAQAVSDAAHALQEAQQAREYAEGLDPSTGDGSYSEAMQAAQQAARDALAAMERANLAVTSASGKSSVRNSTSSPQGVGTAVGDTWFQWTAFPGGTVTGQWTWDGAEWRPVKLSHQVLSSVDLGTATVGKLHGSYLDANSVDAGRLTVGVGGNMIPDAAFTSEAMLATRAAASTGEWAAVRTSTPRMEAAETTGSLVFRFATPTASTSWPTVPGQRWRISVPVDPGGDRAIVLVRWVDATGVGRFASVGPNVTEYTTDAGGIWEAPPSAVGFLVQVNFPTPATARAARVHAGASVQSMTGAVHIEDGAITATKVNAREVAGAIGSFVNVKAENVEVTEALAAKVFSATTATVAEQFVTDRMVIGTGTDATVLEVLGNAVVNDLNLRGTLRGDNAIMSGTITTAQLRVTEEMVAEMGRFMSVETKKLIVTEAAVMQHVTAIEGIITPKITASEAKMGSLIAAKASIEDLAAGNLTLTGNFRSGAVGKPGVIIPKNYVTEAGMQQLGVWLALDGKAPSLGSEWGMTAGMWLDNASNSTGSTNKSRLHIRGQGGAGLRVYGDMELVANGTNPAYIRSAANTNIELIATRNFMGTGREVYWTSRTGDMLLEAYGSGAFKVNSKGSGVMNLVAAGPAEFSSYQTSTIRGVTGLVLQSNGNIALRNTGGGTYRQSWSGSGLLDLKLGSSSGVIYTDSSSRRYKRDIRTMEPDHEWLDLRTVWYRDRAAVKTAEAVSRRQERGDCAPLTAQETEMIAASERVVPGRIAEEMAEISSPQVIYGAEGEVESYDYSRDGAMLIPHVREHRDKIADLESRIAELESALL